MSSSSKGFTVQLTVKPDSSINDGCGGSTTRSLLAKSPASSGVAKTGLDLAYEANDTVQMSFWIGDNRIRLGKSPALPRGAWTHIAYTFDGVTGTFAEYINGVYTGRALPTVNPGSTFMIGTGDLYVGSSSALSTQACPTSGEGSFKGYIDEVRLFSHARSNRSVCLSVIGPDCRDDAIQEDPSSGQFILSHQNPGCGGKDDLGSIACTAAMHRVCAQRGAIDALDSASNLYDTIRQLISSRPPIALTGVPQSSTFTSLTVACAPIEQDSLAVTYEELSIRYRAGCTGDSAAMGLECSAASHRFCTGQGWTTGQIFEVTSRPWISCFDADLQIDVSKTTLGSGCNDSFTSSDCRLAVSQHCKGQGFGGGLIQEAPDSTTANVHCFTPATVETWKYR